MSVLSQMMLIAFMEKVQYFQSNMCFNFLLKKPYKLIHLAEDNQKPSSWQNIILFSSLVE